MGSETFFLNQVTGPVGLRPVLKGFVGPAKVVAQRTIHIYIYDTTAMLGIWDHTIGRIAGYSTTEARTLFRWS